MLKTIKITKPLRLTAALKPQFVSGFGDAQDVKHLDIKKSLRLPRLKRRGLFGIFGCSRHNHGLKAVVFVKCLDIKNRGKVLTLKVKRARALSKFTGLMFRKRKTDNLLFDFSRNVNIPFHSLFVFFPFIIVWLDSKNNVIDFKIAKPFNFCIRQKKKFRRVVEIPLNSSNKAIESFFNRSNWVL